MIEISGFTLTTNTWLIGSIIFAVIGLIAVGITNYDSFDDEAFGASVGIVLLCWIWPVVLVAAVFCIVVLIPIYIGRFIGKGINALEKRKKKKLENMSNVDKILKNKEVD